jgi:hypothetical protein
MQSLVAEHAPSPPASAVSVPPLAADPELPLPLAVDPELPLPLAADPELPLPLAVDPELPLPVPPPPLLELEPDEPEEDPASVTTVRGLPEQPIPACVASVNNTKRTSLRILEYPLTTGVEQAKRQAIKRRVPARVRAPRRTPLALMHRRAR